MGSAFSLFKIPVLLICCCTMFILHTHTHTHNIHTQLWGGEVELVALSKLYGRPLVVYNEQEDSVQEQVFPSSEEEEQPTSAEQLQDPVSLLCFLCGQRMMHFTVSTVGTRHRC